MPRAAIVFNPGSPRIDRLRELVAIREVAEQSQPTLWLPTTDAGPVDALIDQAVAGGAAIVIAAGGDGTVRSVAAAVAGRDLPLGIVPVGTANLLARNLGIPLRRLAASVALAFSGSDQRLDLATIDYRLADGSLHSRPYLVMAGFGVDSDMVGGTPSSEKARLGWAAYVRPILRSLWRAPVDRVRYSLDGSTSVTSLAHSFVVGNGGTITAGLRLLPHARIDDGRLDVLVLRSTRGRDGLSILRWLLPYNLPLLPETGARSDAYRYAQAQSIEVNLHTPTMMQADGDLLGLVAQARFTIGAGVLRVRAPRRSARAPQQVVAVAS